MQSVAGRFERALGRERFVNAHLGSPFLAFLDGLSKACRLPTDSYPSMFKCLRFPIEA